MTQNSVDHCTIFRVEIIHVTWLRCSNNITVIWSKANAKNCKIFDSELLWFQTSAPKNGHHKSSQKFHEMKPNLTAVIFIKFHFIDFSWNYFLCVCRVVFEIIFFISISPKNHFSRIPLWSSEKIKLPKNGKVIFSSFFKSYIPLFSHIGSISQIIGQVRPHFLFNYWNNLF